MALCIFYALSYAKPLRTFAGNALSKEKKAAETAAFKFHTRLDENQSSR
ncbi:hypothetical protein CEV31_2470 [Brucella thiophenivorans]|uniref:Uncharacterized protein n=1 Tax=Brucella thiophenivorans TaxID=571255 RepID=A0A256FWP0_9HYPH|nr:hypothetical protein CEV31_2470 [Brucella thiophenivorans]